MKCGKGWKDGQAMDGLLAIYIRAQRGRGGKGERVRSPVACCEQGREPIVPGLGLAYVTIHPLNFSDLRECRCMWAKSGHGWSDEEEGGISAGSEATY
jgi:hypothetical protein